MVDRYFSQATFGFLRELAANNNRDWFSDNKDRYEELVRTPALTFIEAMAGQLPAISPHFLAVPKKIGGSLMRVHRDTRFGKDKRPYKTNIGIQFRHETGKDVHAPGFYLHIETGGSFVGAGIWRPDATALGKIRDSIVENEKGWLGVKEDKKFNKKFRLEGDHLVNAPRGYAKEHLFLDDLKRKDFIAIAKLKEDEVIGNKLLTKVVNDFSAADSLMRFLCKALVIQY
jgi:uncharacterized protein (TIGR02453 family)